MPNHSYYTGLEVVPDGGPEIVPHSAPELVPSYKENNHYASVKPSEGSHLTIFGLNRSTFWIIFAVSTFVIIGAIVGGVAGGLLSRNDSNSGTNTSASLTSSYLSSSPSLTPTVSTPTNTTSTVILPTATLLRDCPSSNGTLFDVAMGSEEPLIFRKFCTAGLRHVINSIDVTNEATQSLNDCINACVDYNIANKTAIATGNNQTCNAVCWRNTDQLDNINQIPGQCFGFTTGNTSSGFVVTD
ncbi:hypothetical protein F5Y08DRAFT_329897 [Xylaria arbuscula]|nr:hypothetical protein F5Y08DRAFT_329897 [Xylaria arbuscula]